MLQGDRPAIPDYISPKMMELWNVAKKCWSANPGDRPQFSHVLAKLTAFASLESVAPFELREPKPMQVVGEPFRWFS